MSRLLLSTLTLSALLVYAPVSSAQMGPPPAVADVTYEAARLSGQGNYHEAVALCRQALQKWPDQPTLLTCIGDALTNKGAYPEAVENYEKATPFLQKNPGYRQLLAVTLANLSSVYMVLNKLDDAERCADGAIRTLPDFTPAYITKGVVL